MKPGITEEIQKLAERQASFFRALGNPQRVIILWLLAEKEWSISEISVAIGSSLQSASHNLHILEFNNLVEFRREDNNIYCRLVDNEITRNCLVFSNRPKKDLLTEVNPI